MLDIKMLYQGSEIRLALLLFHKFYLQVNTCDINNLNQTKKGAAKRKSELSFTRVQMVTFSFA